MSPPLPAIRSGILDYRPKLIAHVGKNVSNFRLKVGERPHRTTARALRSGSLEKPWRGVEAAHFYILAQRFLYDQREDLAMCCALRCTECAAAEGPG